MAGRDLRALFGLLRKDAASERVPAHSPLLLRALRSMARHEGPTSFFDFATEAGGIIRTTPLRFPSAPLNPISQTLKILYLYRII